MSILRQLSVVLVLLVITSCRTVSSRLVCVDDRGIPIEGAYAQISTFAGNIYTYETDQSGRIQLPSDLTQQLPAIFNIWKLSYDPYYENIEKAIPRKVVLNRQMNPMWYVDRDSITKVVLHDGAVKGTHYTSDDPSIINVLFAAACGSSPSTPDFIPFGIFTELDFLDAKNRVVAMVTVELDGSVFVTGVKTLFPTSLMSNDQLCVICFHLIKKENPQVLRAIWEKLPQEEARELLMKTFPFDEIINIGQQSGPAYPPQGVGSADS